jgi:hypothetical protein
MPIRFSTEAANADVLGDDADNGAAGQGMPKAVGAERPPRQRFSRSQQGERQSGDGAANPVKPGKDINAAGFVKDKDSSKP